VGNNRVIWSGKDRFFSIGVVLGQFYLEVAGFSPAIQCKDGGLYSYMEREMATFRGGHGEDMLLRIDLFRDSVLPAIVPDEYTPVSTPPGLQVLMRKETNEGELLLRVITCQSSEFDFDDDVILFPMLMNLLLSAYLQHINAEDRAHLCLMHACGAIRDGRALLFAGASGAGKSTAAKLLLEDGSFAMLGDDMVPLSRDDSGWRAFGSPLGGDIPREEISNVSAPVQAIYFLSQNLEAGLHRLDTTQALSLLMSSVIPAHEIRNTTNQSIDEYDQESLGVLMDECSLLASEVPCFSLAYKLDEPPWEQIFQSEKTRRASEQLKT
jgi:hypothetical protein